MIYERYFDQEVNKLNDRTIYVEFPTIGASTGIKDLEGKLDYSEINLLLLDLMAERMMNNKEKYPQGNGKKIIPIENLAWAAFRHLRKILQPISNDPETLKDHIAAVACNMSLIIDQLERKP